MKISDELEMLDVKAAMGMGPGVIHPTLLRSMGQLTLVDVGFPHDLPKLQAALAEAGASVDRICRIIVTHSDIDHIGGLAELLAAAPQKIEVLAHEEERPYLAGELPPVRLAAMEQRLAAVPAEQRAALEKIVSNLKANYKSLKVTVDTPLQGGEELGGGLTVIFTPGHTKGHICLYHRPSKTLIAGDALSVTDGELTRCPMRNRLDPEEYERSLQFLLDYDIAAVICYHGGFYDKEPNRRLRELLQEAPV